MMVRGFTCRATQLDLHSGNYVYRAPPALTSKDTVLPVYCVDMFGVTCTVYSCQFRIQDWLIGVCDRYGLFAVKRALNFVNLSGRPECSAAPLWRCLTAMVVPSLLECSMKSVQETDSFIY
jgi:hypothetical protein